jgi:hypothetical protein
MKKRELKYNGKIANNIDKLKKAYRHMVFYEKLSKDPQTKLSNIIVE